MLLGFTVVILVLFLGVLGLQTLFNWIIDFLRSRLNLKKHVFVSKLLVSFLIGLSVWVIFTQFKDAPWFHDIEDIGLDLAMQVNQKPATTKDISYVFLDIDAQTHQLWGEPLLTPRNQVKELIEVAVNGGARLVVVDIDLSKKTPTEGFPQIPDEFQHPYDKVLYDYIANYKNNCPEEPCPAIILNKAFRSVPDFAQNDNKIFPDWFGDHPLPIREPRTSFLDEAVAKSAPYMHWASPLFQPSSFDGAIRRWQLWEPIFRDKQAEVFPTPLLVAALIRNSTPESALMEVNKALAPFKKSAGDHPIAPSESAKNLVFTDTQQYIRFQMRWKPHDSIAKQWVRRYSLQADEKGTQANSVLTVFSAGPYLKYKAETAGILKNKIVIIGSSYESQGTRLTTPLGRMPSELVMINAIHSLLQYGGGIQLSSGLKQFIWAILLIAVVSLILTFVESFWIVALTGISVVILVPMVSFWLIESLWLNLALALLAIHIHQIAASYHDKTIKLKWRKDELIKEIKPLVVKQISKKLVKDIQISLRKNSIPKSTRKYSEWRAWQPPKNDGPIRLLSVQHNRYQRIAKYFSRWPTLARFMTINLVVGLMVAVLLQHFNNNPWLMNAEDASMDWLMSLNRNIIPPIQEHNIPPIVMLDIDELTYHKWGDPLFIPRMQLKDMIESAVTKARWVIVDIDLSHQTPTQDSQLHPDEVALKNYLESYIKKCQKTDNKTKCPTIILRRSVSSPSSSEELAVVRTTFLDEVVTKEATPYVQWASRLFEPTEKRIVRRWKLWQSACTPDNQPEVIPSIELLTMSLVKKDCISQDVQNALQRFQPKDCDSNNTTESLSETFELCDFPVNMEDRWGINQRIKYRLSWSDLVVDRVDTPALKVLSAQPYTESEQPPTQEMLNTMSDSIVIIGKSYKEGYEIYSTPLGDLPSALIIANGIHTLLLPEKLELSPLKELLTTALFIVMLSILFKIFPSGWGMIFSCLLTIFIVLPFTMLYFHYGIWLTIASPLIVVTIFQVVQAKYLKTWWLRVRYYWVRIFNRRATEQVPG